MKKLLSLLLSLLLLLALLPISAMASTGEKGLIEDAINNRLQMPDHSGDPSDHADETVVQGEMSANLFADRDTVLYLNSQVAGELTGVGGPTLNTSGAGDYTAMNVGMFAQLSSAAMISNDPQSSQMSHYQYGNITVPNFFGNASANEPSPAGSANNVYTALVKNCLNIYNAAAGSSGSNAPTFTKAITMPTMELNLRGDDTDWQGPNQNQPDPTDPPIEPEQPIDPEQPIEPELPEDPEPSEPEQPEDPELPEDPEPTVDPGQPADDPGILDPNQPAEPVT